MEKLERQLRLKKVEKIVPKAPKSLDQLIVLLATMQKA